MKIFREIDEIRTLLGSFYKFGYWVGDKRVFDILSYDFLINFKFSRIKKNVFLVRCNSAVSLKH